MLSPRPAGKTPNNPHNRRLADATRRDETSPACPLTHVQCPSTCKPCCTGDSARCPVCNPAAPLHRCDCCDWIGTHNEWPAHKCDNPHPRAETYEIPSPRVAHHVIELLDAVELQPHNPHHVIRPADHSEVPITNVGVLHLLNRPLDQRTTTAVTAELARISTQHVTVGRNLVAIQTATVGEDHDPHVDKIDWADLDRRTRAGEQHTLRSHIAAAVTR